jgi:hypothetical protein
MSFVWRILISGLLIAANLVTAEPNNQMSASLHHADDSAGHANREHDPIERAS